MSDDSGWMFVIMSLFALLLLSTCKAHEVGHREGLKDAAIGTWVAEMDPRTGEWSYRKVDEPEQAEPAHAD